MSDKGQLSSKYTIQYQTTPKGTLHMKNTYEDRCAT